MDATGGREADALPTGEVQGGRAVAESAGDLGVGEAGEGQAAKLQARRRRIDNLAEQPSPAGPGAAVAGHVGGGGETAGTAAATGLVGRARAVLVGHRG